LVKELQSGYGQAGAQVFKTNALSGEGVTTIHDLILEQIRSKKTLSHYSESRLQHEASSLYRAAMESQVQSKISGIHGVEDFWKFIESI